MGVVITNTADARAATAGATVRFTVRVTADEPVNATLEDDLDGLLDDADYDDDAQVTAGRVTYAHGRLRWQGDLEPHTAVTLTFSVTVRCTGGDRTLTNRAGGVAATVPVLGYSASRALMKS